AQTQCYTGIPNRSQGNQPMQISTTSRPQPPREILTLMRLNHRTMARQVSTCSSCTNWPQKQSIGGSRCFHLSFFQRDAPFIHESSLTPPTSHFKGTNLA